MAVIDLPLDELKVYTGSSPKPADFDSYWEKALAEMRGVDPQIELIKSDFITDFADCYDMYFTGVRGARIHVKLLKPKNITKPCPAVLMFHGYTGSAGDWYDKLGYVANGFIVAAMDCRGQGGESTDPGGVVGNTFHGQIIRGLSDKAENLLFRHIFLDTAQLAQIIIGMDDVDEDRVSAKGASQGGALTIACAGLEPRIKKIVPVHPFLSDYKRIWEMDIETGAYIELRDYFRKFDPLHEREDEIFNQLGYIDVQFMAERIKGEVLMAMTYRDDVCPPSTQFAIYNRITAAKKMDFYSDYGHEGLPGHEDRAFKFITE
jgi:cephalosporin-C deacetylase